ncbi:MAG: hypothetical protein QG599_2819 [Pseudomonadota bacterium]|nr:hypothetical protein [Pseudomonadota bacterium]
MMNLPCLRSLLLLILAMSLFGGFRLAAKPVLPHNLDG